MKRKNRPFKIVFTGGPGAGKTTMCQVFERVYPQRVVLVPEAASLLFSGGFPRWTETEPLRAIQTAIFQVQGQLERAFTAKYPDKVLLLDRGTIDGAVYWPGSWEEFFLAQETTLEKELARYDRVIYLESAGQEDYKAGLARNPHRSEAWKEARELDRRNYDLWRRHPHFHLVRNQKTFNEKIKQVLKLLRPEIG